MELDANGMPPSDIPPYELLRMPNTKYLLRKLKIYTREDLDDIVNSLISLKACEDLIVRIRLAADSGYYHQLWAVAAANTLIQKAKAGPCSDRLGMKGKQFFLSLPRAVSTKHYL